jgi:AcrR family transcriptional regulator
MNVRLIGRARGRPSDGAKRGRILAAALQLFAERGYHGTAVPLVAEAASVGTGTIYHYFSNKEQLVNAVFRDAKSRLRAALLNELDIERAPREVFTEIWSRLASFARREPLTFRFLEMQDHVPYLDAESRALEVDVLMPLWTAASALAHRGELRDMPAEHMMALVWGALVGLIKAERFGYLTLTDESVAQAGGAAWAAIARPSPNNE